MEKAVDVLKGRIGLLKFDIEWNQKQLGHFKKDLVETNKAIERHLKNIKDSKKEISEIEQALIKLGVPGILDSIESDVKN
jgi:chromosome segregation ATPase